jgi:hypothetical protein
VFGWKDDERIGFVVMSTDNFAKGDYFYWMPQMQEEKKINK